MGGCIVCIYNAHFASNHQICIYHVSRDTKSYLPLLLPVLLLTLSLTSSGIPSKRVLIPQWIAVSRLAVVVEIVQKVLKIRFAVFFFHEKTKTHRGLIPNVCLKRRGFVHRDNSEKINFPCLVNVKENNNKSRDCGVQTLTWYWDLFVAVFYR